MTTITYTAKDGFEVSFDVESLPVASLIHLVRPKLVHMFSNEVSAAHLAWCEANSAATGEESAAKLAELRDAVTRKIESGEFKTPRVATEGKGKTTRLESIMRDLAKKGLQADLAKKSLTLPRGDKTIKIGAEAFTAEQLISRRLINPRFAPALREQAEKLLAAEQAAHAELTGEDEGEF